MSETLVTEVDETRWQAPPLTLTPAAHPDLDRRLQIAAVIPALNESATIGDAVREVLAVEPLLAEFDATIRVFVVDNGSTDRTAEFAAVAGATVVAEPVRGYGRACWAGVLAAGGAEVVVLLDGDRSDVPWEMHRLLRPLLADQAELVIGSRTLGDRAPGSLLPQQVVGNWIAARLLRLLFGVSVTDIGPFRVIRRQTLMTLGMREMTYGWSVEMIARAARQGYRVREVPVTYRARAAGSSKVSGNLRASVNAGARITAAILRCRFGIEGR